MESCGAGLHARVAGALLDYGSLIFCRCVMGHGIRTYIHTDGPARAEAREYRACAIS